MTFFIWICSIASLLGFIGFITVQIKGNHSTGRTSKKVGTIFAFLFLGATLVSWGWFYFFPLNPVAERIDERITAKYYKNKDGDLVKYERIRLDVKMGRDTVFFSDPYAEPPQVVLGKVRSFFDLGSPRTKPSLKDITTLSFDYECSSSSLEGTWESRTYGKILEARTPDLSKSAK